MSSDEHMSQTFAILIKVRYDHSFDLISYESFRFFQQQIFSDNPHLTNKSVTLYNGEERKERREKTLCPLGIP